MTGKDWVLSRVRCTPGHYVSELVKVIRRDVDRFNNLDRADECERFFVVEHAPDGCTIHRARRQRFMSGKHQYHRADESDQDFVRVSHSGFSITAERADFWRSEIVCSWNDETLACDLILNGQPRDLAYISQRILGDFLFEDLAI